MGQQGKKLSQKEIESIQKTKKNYSYRKTAKLAQVALATVQKYSKKTK